MKELRERFRKIIASPDYVMTLVPSHFTPELHIIMEDEETHECFWLFPQRNINQEIMVPLDLLEADIRRRDLIPVHVNDRRLADDGEIH